MNPNSALYMSLHLAVSAFALMTTAYVVPGFRLSGFISAVITAIVVGLANLIIWPVLIFLTLPLNILTLGLFTFVVNGAVLKICAALVPGFEIRSWGAAIIGAIILSLVSTGFHYILV